MPESDDSQRLDTSTRAAGRRWAESAETRIPALTLLAHPDSRRVGERALLRISPPAGQALLSRSEPKFAQPGQRNARPLADVTISRTPLHLSVSTHGRGNRGSIEIDTSATATEVEVDGIPLSGSMTLAWAVLESGVILCLSRRIVLLLHLADPLAGWELPNYGLVGASDAIGRVRADIQRLAALDVPVLLRGETGTGKELVAAALHRAGSRSHKSLVALNMAAIPPSLAASELFGAVKGAYTGATQNRLGAFRKAHEGTLFLDEIGDTPEEIQALLLRTLENREVQPVGSDRSFGVDVRLVTATDLDLESAAESGRFRLPLLYRVAGYEIQIPPLRERREDFGRLFFHFLHQDLKELHPRWSSAARNNAGWPLAEWIAQLAGRPWPGNIRQLRNAVRQLMILGPQAAPAQLAQWLEASGVERGSKLPSPARATHRETTRSLRPIDIGEDQLAEALRACRYRIQDAAKRLGISRAAVYQLISRSSRLRKASDIDRTEIIAALKTCGGDLSSMVEQLEVSAPALRRRMRQLGLE